MGLGTSGYTRGEGDGFFSLSILFPLHSGSVVVHLILPVFYLVTMLPSRSFSFSCILFNSSFLHVVPHLPFLTTTCSLHHFSLHIFLLFGSTFTPPTPHHFHHHHHNCPLGVPCVRPLPSLCRFICHSPNDSSPLSHINNEKGESVLFQPLFICTVTDSCT